MTREDIEQLNVVEPNCFDSDREELWFNVGLKYGLEIADNNPNISSLWHDVSEEPNENMDILFISKNGKVHKVSKIDNSLYSWLKDNNDVKKWAYINDLLPKGG